MNKDLILVNANIARRTKDNAFTQTNSFGDSMNYAQFSDTGVLSFYGTAGIVLPHTMQSDSTDQSIANVTTDQVITFDTDVHHKLITRTSSSRFTIQYAGTYLIAFSGIAASTLPGKTIEFWLKVNGNNVAASNTGYIFKAANSNTILAVTYLEYFNKDDYFEFWCWGNDTGVRWEATGAVAANPGVTPARPAIPSIIITCNMIAKD